MATQTLSHVVPFPQIVPAVEVITQEELGLILSLRAQLARIQSQVDVAEESLQARLQAGAVVEFGDHSAELKEHSRRNVAWKAIVVRLALRLKMDGEAYCERVLAASKPSKSYSLGIR